MPDPKKPTPPPSAAAAAPVSSRRKEKIGKATGDQATANISGERTNTYGAPGTKTSSGTVAQTHQKVDLTFSLDSRYWDAKDSVIFAASGKLGASKIEKALAAIESMHQQKKHNTDVVASFERGSAAKYDVHHVEEQDFSVTLDLVGPEPDPKRLDAPRTTPPIKPLVDALTNTPDIPGTTIILRAPSKLTIEEANGICDLMAARKIKLIIDPTGPTRDSKGLDTLLERLNGDRSLLNAVQEGCKQDVTNALRMHYSNREFLKSASSLPPIASAAAAPRPAASAAAASAPAAQVSLPSVTGPQPQSSTARALVGFNKVVSPLNLADLSQKTKEKAFAPTPPPASQQPAASSRQEARHAQSAAPKAPPSYMARTAASKERDLEALSQRTTTCFNKFKERNARARITSEPASDPTLKGGPKM